METIKVKASSEYEVIIGENATDNLTSNLQKVTNCEKVLIITDENIAPLHLSDLTRKLDNFNTFSLILKSGEEEKSVESVLKIITFLKDKKFTKRDIIISLGGGVCGDIAAFTASVYFRGIDFVNIPTTLLAQVDSSVGGKTGIDFHGKNVIGTFYQPKLVVCDTNYLKTLPENVFRDGLAEVAKYAFIGNEKLHNVIFSDNFDIEKIVFLCVKMKSEIVFKDEFDKGERQLLNFGHTVGHAIEARSDYKISHGQAVSMGMCIIAKAFERANFCEKGIYKLISDTLSSQKINLPTISPYKISELKNYMLLDKKNEGSKISIIYPKEKFRCIAEKFDFNTFFDILLEGED